MEDETVQFSLAEVHRAAYDALRASRTSEPNARHVAQSVVQAEAEGIRSHGLLRVPTYCEHAQCGKVDGQALPTVERARAAVWIADARDGFAHPAIAAGLTRLVPEAKQCGVAVLAIKNSYNCGVVGHHAERLAEQGLVALICANTPAAIAPWGGNKPLFGTNPIAFAAPRAGEPPLVIDQSASVVARGEVMLRATQGREIPLDWALDADGKPTSDPKAALAGSMQPAGGYKGAGLALMVEVLAAALTGASLSQAASSFVDNRGGPPRTGQLLVAFDPTAFVGDLFTDRIEQLLASMLEQPGVRLPGTKRIAARRAAETHGVRVSKALYDRIARLAQGAA
jgi:(2R)-3-sulfolactate dehydrogenase (NADP+)